MRLDVCFSSALADETRFRRSLLAPILHFPHRSRMELMQTLE